jgi:hypothetical protein
VQERMRLFFGLPLSRARLSNRAAKAPGPNGLVEQWRGWIGTRIPRGLNFNKPVRLIAKAR